MALEGAGVQRLQPLAHLQENVLEQLAVADWAVSLHKVEEVTEGVLLENQDRLFGQSLVAFTPLRKLVVFVPRNIPRHLYGRGFDCEAQQRCNVGIGCQVLVNLHLREHVLAHQAAVNDFQGDRAYLVHSAFVLQQKGLVDLGRHALTQTLRHSVVWLAWQLPGLRRLSFIDDCIGRAARVC